MSSSSDSSSRGVSRDKRRKRDKERKYRESRSRSRSAQRNRDRSRKRSKDKVREKQKENKYRRKSKSGSRHRKRGRSRSRSSRSHPRGNSIELRSRSASRDKKQERDEKLKKERREKKYDNEVDRLKEKEIEKQREFEKKLNPQNQNLNNLTSNKNSGSEMNNLNSNKSVYFGSGLDKKMTEEEREEMLKKQRLAKARVFVLVEREEEKKNEEMLIENRGLIQDDFLEENDADKTKQRDKLRFDDEKHFDDLQSDNEMENEKYNDKVNMDNKSVLNKAGIGELNAIQTVGEKAEIALDFEANSGEKINKSEEQFDDGNVREMDIDAETKGGAIGSEEQQINLTLGHRNMPHLPHNFFINANNKNIHHNKNLNHKKSLDKSKPENKRKIDPLLGVSLLPQEKAATAAQPAVTHEYEEDPLDAYMKSIEKDATLQDYQIYQELLNQQFQQKYDEAVARDSRSEAFSAMPRISNASDADEDNVKVIEDNAEMEIDESKIITLEDILKMNEQNAKEENIKSVANENNSNMQLVLFHRGEDDLDKKFIETLKNTNVPDYDPLYGYSSTNKKQELVLYREDYNEYMKEDEFSGFAEEEAWLKLKKSTTEKKELKLVNHSLINYEPFRKNLYVESKEITKLTEDEVEKMRKEQGDIKVRGKSIPNPISNWYQCGLSEKIFKVLERKNFGKPFPIQAQAIPCIMSGRDVIGIAETGSGKTLAFVLPMLRHVLDQRPLKSGEGPIAFIMAPTRELAFQIYSETKSFCKHLKLNVSCVYGGAGIGAQISELRRGAEIVICTPGRMIDVLCLSNGNVTNLRRVTFVVIDEADRMFDLGFEPQIARILANIRHDRQTVMFSATFPKQIESLAKKILNKPIEIVVGNRGQSCTNVQQYVEVRDDSSKLYRLLEILGEYSQENFGIIIFVDKQIEADELFKELFHLGYQSLVIHGGQDQEDRDFAIMDFKNGVRNILITTSVCARGLDVKHCGLVVNFKCPNHMEDYVHRVGRTGRAGKTGVAYTFISPDEAHLAEDILRVLEISKQPIPEELRNLVRNYKERLENGEVDKFRISGYVGRGYRFDEGEKEKVKQTRAGLKKGYGMDPEEDEDMDIKGNGDKNDDETGDAEGSKKKYALQLFSKPKDEEKKKQISKDPKARQIAIECGMNAAKNAIISGKTPEEAMKMAQQAIETALAEYKPSVSTEKGVEQAAKIIEEWVERENEKNNIFTCELDINEYPNVTRGKVLKKDFLESMGEMTQCTIAIRGTFVEPGKKPPIGQKRLHLYLQGNTKTDVAHAYREIKKVLDESALNFYTKGASMGFAGKTGKYSV